MKVQQNNKITVIGLGAMGLEIARIFMRNSLQVTLWNRTAAKADKLVEEGAVFTSDIAEAIAASPVIVICVYNYKAVNEILSIPGASGALSGKIVIQLTTGSPQEARDAETWFHQFNARYLDGALQVAPEQMAQPDTTILLSGAEPVFRHTEPLLNMLGGRLTYLGSNIAAAAAMDLATLSYIYGAAMGFMHGVLISENEGFNVQTYGEIVSGIAPGMGEFLKHEGTVIQKGDFAISQSPLAISVEATERILQTAKEAGINTEFPTFAAGILKRAAEAGYGNEEFAAIVKLLRKKK